MNEYAEKAKGYFDEGYNCCQAVVKAFLDDMDDSGVQLTKIASSFGGGIGRMREVCGAVSGMAIVLGMKSGFEYGFLDEEDKEAKNLQYDRIAALLKEFKKRTGALTCRDLLHLDENDEALPGYENIEKPCPNLVYTAADILSDYLYNH